MTSAPDAGRSAARRAYIDWARALAVLVMMEAHVLDAWTRAADKRSVAYGYAMVLGGFAAPMFLWLAGLSLMFSAAAIVRRGGTRAAAVSGVCSRGLEIFILAFLFRLQAFILSPGSHPVTLFRVDILNVMGPAMVAAGLVWGVSARTPALTALYAAIAAGVALATPIVRESPLVGWLPTWVRWYLAPAADNTTFTGFPWAGFVFAGAACGTLLAAARGPAAERRLHGSLAAVGAALVWGGFYTASMPSIYRHSSFWTSSPTFFCIRVGVLMLSLSTAFVLAGAAERYGIQLRRLERFGRRSLFVYWIHVELVYGYASWLWRGRLPLWGSVLAYVAFALAMYGAVVLRDLVVDAWRNRRINPSLQATPA